MLPIHITFIPATCMKYFNVQLIVQFINKTAYSHAVSDVTTSTSDITVEYCNQN